MGRRHRYRRRPKSASTDEDESSDSSSATSQTTSTGSSPATSGAGYDLLGNLPRSEPSSASDIFIDEPTARPAADLVAELNLILADSQRALRGRASQSPVFASSLQLGVIRKRLQVLCLDLLRLQLSQMAAGQRKAVGGTKELYKLAERLRETMADAAATYQDIDKVRPVMGDRTTQSTAISACFPQDQQDIEFDMHFAWKQQVAVGSRGPVYRAVCTKAYTTKLGKHINAGTDVAVKVFLLERLSTNQRAQLQTEFQILREIGNIETCEELLDGFQTAADLLLVKTLCPVIPLCDAVATSAPGGLCSEGLVADFSEPVFATVAELHRLDIVHGSISPKTLRMKEAETGSLAFRLTRFATACFVKQAVKMSNSSGSADLGMEFFVAPELREAGSLPAKAVDAWSLGALLYLLLLGSIPQGRAECSMLTSSEAARNTLFDRSDRKWNSLSPQAQDLLLRLLEVVPDKRVSASAALRHPWWAQARSSQGQTQRPESTRALHDTLASIVLRR